MALKSCARVLSRLRSLCLPATGEAHRRAIGTKFPLPITIKAPAPDLVLFALRANRTRSDAGGPGVGGGNFVPIARRCASQSRAGFFQENTWPRISVYLRKHRQGHTFGEPDCIQYCIQYSMRYCIQYCIQ